MAFFIMNTHVKLEAEVGIEPAYADLQSARTFQQRQGIHHESRFAILAIWAL